MSAKPALLIVDDDLDLVQMLVEFFSLEEFDVEHAGGGRRALAVLGERRFDLVVLDIMMPGLDGLEVLRLLRIGNEVPVIMLTARGQDEDRIAGLELGADDYLAKPFNPRELMARVRAILRRRERRLASPGDAFRVGLLSLNTVDLSATMDGCPVRLTTAEFMVLEVLARSAGRVQSRAALTERALGRPLEAYDRSVDTHVSNLRRKLGLRASANLEIRSVRGTGYVLISGAPAP